MPEFTMTFSGPRKCAYCNGPIGEVAYFNEDDAHKKVHKRCKGNGHR